MINDEIDDAIVRELLNKALGFELPEDIWAYLLSVHPYTFEDVKTGLATSAFEDRETIDDLANKAKKAMELRGASVASDAPKMFKSRLPKPDTVVDILEAREFAVSILAAERAGREPEVKDFRATVLNSRLLQLNEVEEWVSRQENLTPEEVLEFVEKQLDEGKEEYKGTLSQRWAILEYGIPDNEQKKVTVTMSGILERLAGISSMLSRSYGWKPAQATLFILTGSTPKIPLISAEVEYNRVAAASRIVLHVDPALTSQQVANQYGKVRKAVMGKRNRSLSPKHLLLGLFCIRFKGSLAWTEQTASIKDEKTWEQLRRIWNKESSSIPDWHYDEVWIFSRDGKQALKRLLNTPKFDYSIFSDYKGILSVPLLNENRIIEFD